MGRGPILGRPCGMTRSLDATNIFRFVFAKCLPPQDAADRLLPPEHAAERALPPQDATKRARGVIVVENDQKIRGLKTISAPRPNRKSRSAKRENMMANVLSTRRAGS